MFKLINRACLSAFVFILCASCEECLDMELIEENTDVIESWFTNQEITNKLVTSSINISDSVNVVHNYNGSEESIFDDCGNVSGSFENQTSYSFNNFPFSIVTIFRKQGEENGFKFLISSNEHDAYYEFNRQISSTGNTVELLNNYDLNNQNYEEIFKVSFGLATEPTEIKTIFYAKDTGVVFIELNNGITLNLE